jgi:putative ABC transport system ATP-binding protein
MADQILELLTMLNRKTNKTIVMVTHDPRAANYASRRVNVDKGLLLEGVRRAA